MNGVYRFIRHYEIEARIAAGWTWCCALTHDSSLMWWCCGDCKDGEAP